MILTGPSYIPTTPVKKIIITLHGYGANGQNLFDCGLFIANKLNESIAVYSPNAIEPFDFGYDAYQWFGLPDLTTTTLEKGIHKALPFLFSYIEELQEKHSLTSNDIILFGFSQGCMIALSSIFYKKFHCVVGCSGMLIPPLNPIITSPQTPVFLTHGTHDPVVPYSSLIFAQELLKQNNVPVKTLSRSGLDHSIDDTILIESVNFIKSLDF